MYKLKHCLECDVEYNFLPPKVVWVLIVSAACGSAADIPPSGSRKAGETVNPKENPVNFVNPACPVGPRGVTGTGRKIVLGSKNSYDDPIFAS